MDRTTLEEKLQTELETVVRENKEIFSAALGVADASDHFYWTGAAGIANPGAVNAMTTGTPVFMASITKMYTAAATMILAERGMLALDDPLTRFLSASLVDGLHVYKGRDYTDQLRVYHLVSQTSGLPDYFEESPTGGKSIREQLMDGGDMAWDLAEVVRIARHSLNPKFPPETPDKALTAKRAYYADTNYQLLGRILEAAANMPLAEIFSDLILHPLELSSTYLHTSGSLLTQAERPATIYHKTRPLFLDRAMASFGPDGGLVSNIGDSLAFIKALLEGRLFNDPETLPRMKNWKRIFFPFQYGFGLMRFKYPRILSPFYPVPELVGHAGASSAFLFYSQADQLYIAGTLNQLENQRRPINLVIKTLKTVSTALS